MSSYQKMLDRWRELHRQVCDPRFNVTRDAEKYAEYLALGDTLKKEDDFL